MSQVWRPVMNYRSLARFKGGTRGNKATDVNRSDGVWRSFEPMTFDAVESYGWKAGLLEVGNRLVWRD
jgi:hypothetical protein